MVLVIGQALQLVGVIGYHQQLYKGKNPIQSPPEFGFVLFSVDRNHNRIVSCTYLAGGGPHWYGEENENIPNIPKRVDSVVSCKGKVCEFRILCKSMNFP